MELAASVNLLPDMERLDSSSSNPFPPSKYDQRGLNYDSILCLNNSDFALSLRKLSTLTNEEHYNIGERSMDR